MRKKTIIFNWKMAPQSLAEAEELIELANNIVGLGSLEVENSLVFCPPFVFLEDVGRMIKMSHLEDIAFLGSQDLASSEASAQTGEISGTMLKKMGVSHVIVGHSERRWKLNESVQTINHKIKLALQSELTPIVCIGEKEKLPNSSQIIQEQAGEILAGLSAEEIKNCLIAYEPVWAISSNLGAESDTPENAVKAIEVLINFITDRFEISENIPHFIYGGSINSKNIKEFLDQELISGVLIGSASVNKEEFKRLLDRLIIN